MMIHSSTSSSNVCKRRFVLGFTWVFLHVLPAWVHATTEDIVGSWRRPDNSVVEFRSDGAVAVEFGIIGKWERLRDSPRFVLRFTGARDFYYVTVGGYKRVMTMELQSRGTRTVLERVDNGPTQNFDAPDEKTALEMEKLDLQAEIERASIDLASARKEAAVLWDRYYEARRLGRATGMNMPAQQKDAEIKRMELRLVETRKRMALITSRLGSLR